MSEPRPPQDFEVSAIIDFLNKHLRSSTDWSIADEYPQAMSVGNHKNIRIITENGRIVAHAVTKFILVKNSFGLFRVAAIGSVVTHPDFRNKGYSQKIIESCLQLASDESADFAILWTDLFDFYRKFDFELAGHEVSVVIERQPQILASPSLKILKTNKVSPEAILRLFNQHTCSTVRTSDDIRKYLQIPNSRVYTAWGADQQLLAYAIEGKGADLKGYIHEWAGQVPELLQLFSEIRRDHNAPTTVLIPQNSQNLIRQLQKWDVTVNHGFLGMIRPIDFNQLFFKIHRRARQLGIADFVLNKTDVGFEIGTKNDVLKMANTRDLTRLLFGPVNQNELKPDFLNLIPIPMWVWGWDSV